MWKYRRLSVAKENSRGCEYFLYVSKCNDAIWDPCVGQLNTVRFTLIIKKKRKKICILQGFDPLSNIVLCKGGHRELKVLPPLSSRSSILQLLSHLARNYKDSDQDQVDNNDMTRFREYVHILSWVMPRRI